MYAYILSLGYSLTHKGPFIATQLNSTSSWVELRRYKRDLRQKEALLSSTGHHLNRLHHCLLMHWSNTC